MRYNRHLILEFYALHAPSLESAKSIKQTKLLMLDKAISSATPYPKDDSKNAELWVELKGLSFWSEFKTEGASKHLGNVNRLARLMRLATQIDSSLPKSCRDSKEFKLYVQWSTLVSAKFSRELKSLRQYVNPELLFTPINSAYLISLLDSDEITTDNSPNVKSLTFPRYRSDLARRRHPSGFIGPQLRDVFKITQKAPLFSPADLSYSNKRVIGAKNSLKTPYHFRRKPRVSTFHVRAVLPIWHIHYIRVKAKHRAQALALAQAIARLSSKKEAVEDASLAVIAAEPLHKTCFTWTLFDFSFLKQERLYTKLKYSRTPSYDTASSGVAVLFAGFLGFLISEKFGIELVDSGDFYMFFMFLVVLSFSLRPLIRVFSKDGTPWWFASPKFLLNFYHTLTLMMYQFSVSLVFTLVKYLMFLKTWGPIPGSIRHYSRQSFFRKKFLHYYTPRVELVVGLHLCIMHCLLQAKLPTRGYSQFVWVLVALLFIRRSINTSVTTLRRAYQLSIKFTLTLLKTLSNIYVGGTGLVSGTLALVPRTPLDRFLLYIYCYFKFYRATIYTIKFLFGLFIRPFLLQRHWFKRSTVFAFIVIAFPLFDLAFTCLSALFSVTLGLIFAVIYVHEEKMTVIRGGGEYGEPTLIPRLDYYLELGDLLAHVLTDNVLKWLYRQDSRMIYDYVLYFRLVEDFSLDSWMTKIEEDSQARTLVRDPRPFVIYIVYLSEWLWDHLDGRLVPDIVREHVYCYHATMRSLTYFSRERIDQSLIKYYLSFISRGFARVVNWIRIGDHYRHSHLIPKLAPFLLLYYKYAYVKYFIITFTTYVVGYVVFYKVVRFLWCFDLYSIVGRRRISEISILLIRTLEHFLRYISLLPAFPFGLTIFLPILLLLSFRSILVQFKLPGYLKELEARKNLRKDWTISIFIRAMYLVAFNYNFFCKGVPSLLVWLVRKARLFEPVNLLKKILKNLPRYSFQLLKLVFIIKIAPYYILLVYLVRVLGLLEEEAQEFLRRRSFIGTIAYVVRLVANDFDRLCEKLTSSKLFVKYPLQLLKLAFVIKITPYCVFFFYLVRVLGLLEEEAQEFLRRKSFIGTIMYVARLVANNFDRLWRDACLAANNFDRLWEKLTPSKLFVKYSFQLLKLAFVIKITPYCVFFFYLVRVLGLLEEEGWEFLRRESFIGTIMYFARRVANDFDRLWEDACLVLNDFYRLRKDAMSICLYLVGLYVHKVRLFREGVEVVFESYVFIGRLFPKNVVVVLGLVVLGPPLVLLAVLRKGFNKLQRAVMSSVILPATLKNELLLRLIGLVIIWTIFYGK